MNIHLYLVLVALLSTVSILVVLHYLYLMSETVSESMWSRLAWRHGFGKKFARSYELGGYAFRFVWQCLHQSYVITNTMNFMPIAMQCISGGIEHHSRDESNQVTGLVNVVSSSLHTLPLPDEQLGVDTCDVLSMGASHGSHVSVSSHS